MISGEITVEKTLIFNKIYPFGAESNNYKLGLKGILYSGKLVHIDVE